VTALQLFFFYVAKRRYSFIHQGKMGW